MDKKEKLQRCVSFALRVIKLCASLTKTRSAERAVIGKQLLRCATSVGANYRAACHAKSRADFLAKIKICEEEADESEYWLELIVLAGLVPSAQLQPLRDEAHEIASMMASAAKTTRAVGAGTAKL